MTTKSGRVLARISMLLVFAGIVASCSTGSVDPVVTEEPNLSGVWVDSARGVSTLELENGSFTAFVSNPFSPFSDRLEGDPGFKSPDYVYHGAYEIQGDSVFLDYVFDDPESTRREPFRFHLSGDSLTLFFHTAGGIDSSFNERDTLHLNGYPSWIGLPSLLWEPMTGKSDGVFHRVK